jgi:hypothetical protein
VGIAVSTVLPSKSSIAPAAEVVASFIEVHEQGGKLGRGQWRPVLVSPGLDGLTRSRAVPMVSTARAAVGLSRGSKLTTARARSASSKHLRPVEHDDVGLVEVNIDSSKVCLSCQTHSVAAGKLDVSMVSTVLEVHHRDVVVGLEVEPSLENVSVPTNGDHRESSRKQCQGVYRHKGGDFPAGRISTRKLVQHGHERDRGPRRPWAWR